MTLESKCRKLVREWLRANRRWGTAFNARNCADELLAILPKKRKRKEKK
jgi:hypothetical protein